MKLLCKKCGAQIYVDDKKDIDECPDCKTKFNYLEYEEDELWQKDFTRDQARTFVRNNCEEIVFDEGNTKVLLEFATGVGKSINAINLQRRLYDEWDFRNTVIFVSESSHIKNWQDEYKKHGHQDLLCDTRIMCYNSIEKAVLGGDIDILILDEVHHMNTELRIKALSKIKPYVVIGLSATLDDSDKNVFDKTFLKEDPTFTYKITLSEAIAMNLVPKPRIKIIEMELDDFDNDYVIEINRGDVNKAQHIICNYIQRNIYLNNVEKYRNLRLTVKCTQKERYAYLQNEYYMIKKMANKYGNEVFLNKLKRKGLERKLFLANSKTKLVKKLTDSLKTSKRFICFCGTISQSEYLDKKNSIHNKKPNNEEILTKFNAGTIDSLFAVGMLKEGTNLNNIQSAVIVQLDGDERPFIQKTGRALRAEFPIVYLFKMKNTKDEELFDNVLANIPPEYVEYISI